MALTLQGGAAGPQASVLIGSVAVPVTVPVDASGNAVALVGGLALFRDSVATAQVGTTATTPGAGATIATVTPGTAGLWEVTGTIGITGTTVAGTDSNNMRLRQTTTTVISAIPLTVPGTTGAPYPLMLPPVILNLSAADTVNIIAIALATTGAVYAASIVCRRVG